MILNKSQDNLNLSRVSEQSESAKPSSQRSCDMENEEMAVLDSILESIEGENELSHNSNASREEN